MTKRTAAILIPAHNEARVLRKTLTHLLGFFPKRDIYLVSDGSSDSTVKIAKSLLIHVLTIKSNQGKAAALNIGINKFQLNKKYKYLIPLDADTLINPNFIASGLKTFRQPSKRKIVAVVGRVRGQDINWLTSYRLWEYEVAHTIHKSAQSITGTIIVCPGCSTIFLSSIFSRLIFSGDCVAEDMDLTFTIHRKKLGRIVFCSQAHVTTQDPNNLSDYIKQTDRWYTGLWQAILKHNLPWGGQRLDLEVAMLATEGLFSGLFIVTFLISAPIIFSINPAFVLLPVGLDIAIFLVPTLILALIRHRSKNLIRYIPQIYFTRILTSLIFLKSFANVITDLDLKMIWHRPTRYRLN